MSRFNSSVHVILISNFFVSTIYILRSIYECNKYCLCNAKSCTNRVVQNGIQHRIQVFYTGKPGMGWGLKSLDDIPKGSYICSYIGHILTEQSAEEVYIYEYTR